jgi:Flp pilus assembly protein TadB
MNKWLISFFLTASVTLSWGQIDYGQNEDSEEFYESLTIQEDQEAEQSVAEGEAEGFNSVSTRKLRKNLKREFKSLKRGIQADIKTNDLLLIVLAVILALLLLAIIPDLVWLAVLVLFAYLIYIFLLRA